MYNVLLTLHMYNVLLLQVAGSSDGNRRSHICLACVAIRCVREWFTLGWSCWLGTDVRFASKYMLVLIAILPRSSRHNGTCRLAFLERFL